MFGYWFVSVQYSVDFLWNSFNFVPPSLVFAVPVVASTGGTCDDEQFEYFEDGRKKKVKEKEKENLLSKVMLPKLRIEFRYPVFDL